MGAACIYYACLWCAVLWRSADSFNLEPRLPVLKVGERGTYFGYSVAEHQILDSRKSVREHVLLVGSPRASTSQPGTNHSGAVYRCPLTTRAKDCTQIDIENHDDPPEDDEIKDDQWLGVTVKSQGPGGYVLACAHRYIKKGPDYQWGQGICYSLSQNLDIHLEWEPCLNRPVAKAHEQFGYCQAGTSATISEDFKLVIGTPGPFTWRGTVFVNSVKFGIRDDKNWYYGPLLDDEAPVSKYSYLGMSVTSGKFFGNETSFVGGAPRGNGTGQVVFFQKDKMETEFLVQLILNGEQFASSYGFSLAALDINSDGFIDLVVGAPFYYEKSVGGAVYIYMNSEDGISEETIPIKLTGKHESQFGLALSPLGDLNRDGYPDLAVGAPYEEVGAVYIYLGSAEGLVKEPSQIIRVSSLAKEARNKRELRTFGYSLSGGLDLDNNGYPDLLVGAYDSDSVLLIRSRPIIDVVTSVEGNLTNIDPKVKGCPEDKNSSLVCFSFEACFQFNSSVLSHGTSIKIRYRIVAETFTGKKYYRAKFKSSLDSETPNIVEKDVTVRGVSLYDPHCSRQLVYLEDKTDIQTPVKFQLTYSLIQKIPKMASEGSPLPDINLYPILNQMEASKIFEAKFFKDCGSNDICESDLSVFAELNLPRQESGIPVFHLGEKQVNLSVTLYNYKEPAYNAALFVSHPPFLSYIGRKVVKGEQAECFPFNSTVLKCEIGNPMIAGEVDLQVRFSSRNVSDSEKKLKFVIRANTTSIEVSPEEDLILMADIVVVAELELRGVSNPEQVVYSEPVVPEEGMKMGEDMKTGEEIKTEDDIGSLIIHTYELINYGPWKAKEVEVHIRWPYQTETYTKNGKWLLYLMEAPKVQGNGYCVIDPNIINPLNLLVKKEDDPFIRNPEPETRESELREKREAPAPEEIRHAPLNIATMDCAGGTAKCHFFKCYFRDLLPDKNSLISIRSRLWSKTLVEDFPSVDQVDIISRAQIYLDADLDIQQKLDNDYAYSVTKAIPDLPLYQKPEEVPLWVIILAVLGGILLLILLIFCLYKLGFFKRKKPGYVPASINDKEKDFREYTDRPYNDFNGI